MLDRERELFRQEPYLVGALVCAVLGVALLASMYLEADTPTPKLIREPTLIKDGPAEWRKKSGDSAVLRAAGIRVAYWGNPRIDYSSAPDRKPRAIIVHCNYPCPDGRSREAQKQGEPFFCKREPPSVQRTKHLIMYLHNGDRRRRGRFGYHLYISQTGAVAQGAPLTQRTNHIKRPRHRMRRSGVGASLSNSNTIGISIVGACDPRYSRRRERITVRARDAALKTVKAIQKQFKLLCKAIYGHGELQRDRWSVEGATIAKLVRKECE